jgi:aminoglycoside phosphotransferase (APT) family kinase protein
MSEGELAERLAHRLSLRWQAEVTIHGLRRLTGGASRETWAFEARLPDGQARRLALRRDPPGQPQPESMALEARVVTAARDAGVPVPALVDHDADASVLGSPYLMTAFVDGESIPRKLLRDDRFESIRPTLARELGRVLARIHRIPPSAAPGLPRTDPLDELVAAYDALDEPLPPLEIALHWLRAHRPPATPDAVVHGDFRNGNLIVAPDGLRAVLDWELVHLGDPMEDLGWLCVKAWRFGMPQPVGGFGAVEELLDGYAEVAGTRPDPEVVYWWQVFGTARWGVICRSQAQRHLSGQTPSVELAAIGRRVCEQEHDLLLALGIPVTAPPEPASPAASDLHGRPTIVDLVAAVGEFLRTDVLAGTEGRVNFHTRVAANVLATVERELSHGADQERRHAERLATLGVADQREFAAALRDGTLDPDDPAVLTVISASVTDRLLVANPRYLTHPD